MEIPDAVEPYLQHFDAVLLENHGALTYSDSLLAAYHKMESTEFYAQLLYQSMQIGGPQEFSMHSQLANTSKMRIILDKFPVFVLGFLAVVLLNTFGFMSKEEAKMAGNFMNWCFLLGFSSIGLTTHLSDIKAAGLSGALIGFCVASVKAGLALLVVLCFLQ